MANQVAHGPLFIQGSNWAIENIIETPIDSVLGDPAFVYVNAFSLIFRVVVQLEKLFVKKKKTRSSRKIGEDQFNIFRSLERSLAHSGVDGRACLLRTICEMQQVPLNQYSIMGEILAALLTPKRTSGNMMHEYLDAQRLGQTDSNSCPKAYPSCPMSFFNMMRTYSTPADKPHDHHHSNNVHNYRDPDYSEAKQDDEPGGRRKHHSLDYSNGLSESELSCDMF